MLEPNAAAPVLRMEGLTKRFGATLALDNVSFELRPGEIRALLGENGAGKSTLVKILSGALRADAGRMTIDGRPYAPDGPLAGRRRGVSMIYQELTLCPHLTVAENIMLGRELRRGVLADGPAMGRRVREALAVVHHPEIAPDRPVRRLSIGAKQVVEIARALLLRAKILVMDEPTSSLSQEDSQRLFILIRSLRDQGVGVIYISHFLEEVQQVADTYTVLRDGRNVGDGPMAGTRLDDIIRLMVGQTFTEMFPRVEHDVGGPVLTARGLRGIRMSSPITLELRRGEILGVAGLVGSGRTEFLRTVFGLDRTASGVVEIRGAERRTATPWQRIRQGLGLLSEDRQGEGLALARSIADNLTLSDFSPYVRRGVLKLRRQRQAAGEWISRMKIRAQGPVQPVLSLSGGNQQKVALARLLHQRADVLLLDEPTRGIDVVSKAQIYELVGQLARQGKAVLFVSSYFPELLGVCDRIAVFHRGTVVEVRERSGWTAESLMTGATVGRPAAG
ncbi:MAG: sugar ABC transporter ATP-binding protein [Candidatus Aminicenantes bacterium]|nr:sugar ABC transporter ATP-binding protein [Candidatus Aminicenantes bacterium]